MKRLIGLVTAGIALCFSTVSYGEVPDAQTTIVPRMDFSIVGLGLKASPDYQAVPKGIASKVVTGFDAGPFDVAALIAQLPTEYTVRAELTGPAFQTPLSLVTRPGQPFDLPTLAILGKYTLANIRLCDGQGNTIFGAAPQAVAIESIPDPLITSVTTRQLTVQELKERGVTFDSSNFTAYEFTAGIATTSGQVPITLPVVVPTSQVVQENPDVQAPSNITLPQAETVVVPPEVPETAVPQNLVVKPFLMEVEDKELVAKYKLPTIPGVVVIPGNIGFLHQYFSALALVTNGAPLQSGLTIRDVTATISFPAGEDRTAGTDEIPGDDPIRMAKGANGFFPRTMGVMNAGADGKAGTGDDTSGMRPGESGQADFTIEGLKEGTHKLDFDITAILDGLPISPVTLKGKATGAVLVRNPNFALTFGHPATVRTGEAYDLFVTVTNTGKSLANLVSVNLDPRALSGAAFATGETSTKAVDTILPGSAATIRFRLVSQRTGKVTATTIESDNIAGRFVLRTGVGEKGIPLSPDSLTLPYTGSLPSDLINSAVGLLGQAWSVATAPNGALSADVLPISKQTVIDRAYDLSEQGLRVLLVDTPFKATADLAFDFFGSDMANRGFDSLRRSSTQGDNLNRALAALFKDEIAAIGTLAFQAAYADKVSYRPGHLSVITTEAPVRVRIVSPTGSRTGGLVDGEKQRGIPYADQLLLTDSGTSRSSLTMVTKLDPGSYSVELVADAAASLDLGIIVPDATGVLQQLAFTGLQMPAGGKGTITLTPGGSYLLSLDNGVSIAPSSVTPIALRAPHLVAATQLVPGFGPGGDKHGRTVAVLFDRRVTGASGQDIANYGVDENVVKQATLQPGSRMAFLLLRDGIGPFFARSLTCQGVTDTAGRSMLPETLPVTINARGPAAVVTGTVRSARGEPVPHAPIRLYQYIWYDDGYTIEQRYALFTEKEADADGSYRLEYVLQNDDPAGPFKIEATNPATIEVGSLTTGVVFHGQRLNLDILMKSRGSLSGVVRSETGSPVGGASVQIITLADGRGYTVTTDAAGAFSFTNVMVGAYSLKGVHQATLSQGSTMGTLPEDGAAMTQDLTIRRIADSPVGTVAGKVLNADGTTPRSGVIVIVEAPNYKNWQRSAADGSYSFSGVYAGAAKVTARDDTSGETCQAGGTVTSGTTAVVNLIMGGTGTVAGQVQRDDTKSPEGLYVILTPSQGQKRVLLTDATGSFRSDGLPIGNVAVEILDPKDFNRTIASGSVTILSANDVANIALYVPLKALATGTIQGTVYHRDGTVWRNAPIRQLVNSTQYYARQADGEGHYSLPGLGLGGYQFVVLAGSEVVNVSTDLWYDGQVRTLDLHPVSTGTVTGTTWDDSAKTRPTGADVTLVSLKPSAIGWLGLGNELPVVVKSDPQTGRFTFTNVYVGSFSVSSSNIFRPTPVSQSGTVTEGATVNVDLLLKGSPPVPGVPPVNEPGSVSGQVLKPDGTPAGEGVRVTITFGGADVTVTTDAFGKFRFTAIIPAGNQTIRAEDPVTTLKWRGSVSVPSGLDVPMTIKLLGRGTLTVKVINPGTTAIPQPGAAVSIKGTDYPNDTADGVTEAHGLVTFTNLTEGSYAISASGSGGRSGRSQSLLPADGVTVTATVTLDSSGSVTGRFLKADGQTPIGGGQIRLVRNGQTVAYATSSSDPADLGRFGMNFVPLGDFTVDGYDPVTERRGVGAGYVSADGQTVTADVVVTPRGTVKGTVLNYGGTAPISGATVAISVSGVTGYGFSSVTAPDGSFLFAGVPAGRFTIDAGDPVSGLHGQTTGTLSYESETVTAQVKIAPIGAIAGKVFLPDGVTPVPTASVWLNGGSQVQVNQETGGFRYDTLAAGRSYTLSASQPTTRRTGSTVATISRDGEVAVGDIVLRGVGIVTGTVLDSDGVTPLSGAKVELRAGSLNLIDYTGSDGNYTFGDIPSGSFSVTATHPERVTGASASGSIMAEGDVKSFTLVLGPVAGVTGTVLLADGVTLSRGGGIRLTTNTGRVLTGITDSSGRFSFTSIPTPCTVSIYVEDAAGVGIGRFSGSLVDNGQVLDAGTIVLDDKPIAITAVHPAAGASAVPINQVLRVLFSEPADPATVSQASVYLSQGGSRISGTILLDEDRSGLTFTPAAPLKGFTTYTFVITGDITDRIGRKLAQAQSVSFTTIDNVPPTVTVVSPAAATLQVSGDAVIRLTFSEGLDAASLDGIRLTFGNDTIPTRTDLLQGGTVVALTPLEPLPLNRVYTVSTVGVRDAAGNTLAGTFNTCFTTMDTIIPKVTGLTVPANADLIKGNGILVTAQVADSDVALVDFYVDDVRKGTATTAPFSLPLTLTEGVMHLKAIAQDRVGNRGIPAVLDLNVAADQPPQVTITLPTEGTSTVGTGTILTITAQATDDLFAKEMTLTANGEATMVLTRTNPGGKSFSATFTLAVPSVTTGDGRIKITVVAKDSGGNLSLVAQRTLTVLDIIPPTPVSLTSPGQTILYRPGESGSAVFIASDNIGVASVACTASGAATGSQTFPHSPPLKQVPQNFTFQVNSDAAPYAAMSVICIASDAAGNQASRTVNLVVADVAPPTVTGTSVADNATNVPVKAAVTVTFSETLAHTSVGGVTVAVTATNQAVPGTVTLSPDRYKLTFVPTVPFLKGTTYVLTVSTVTDDAGNQLTVPYHLTYTTDGTAATLASVSVGSTDVPVGAAIGITFTEPLDPTSVTDASFILTSSFGKVDGAVSISADSTSATFKPYKQLSFGRDYTMTIKAGIRDMSGNASISDYTFSFRTQSPSADLVGFWTMDGDWSDSSGNGNHGTQSGGATFSSDHLSGTTAGYFNGSAYLSIPTVASLQPVNAVTVEAWVNPIDVTTNHQIVTKRYADFADPYNSFILSSSGGGAGNKWRFCVSGGSSGSQTCVTSIDTVKAGEWSHVVGTYDGAFILIYVNGELKGSAPKTGLIGYSTQSLRIGTSVPGTGQFFHGLIDDVALYNRALPSEDLREHYNAGLNSDRVVPSIPTVNPVPAETYSNVVVLSGTKDTNASVRVNGKQVVEHDLSTTWQALYSLTPGQNILKITSRSVTGTESGSVTVTTTVLPANQKDPDIVGIWHLDGNWFDFSGNWNTGIPFNGAAFTGDRIEGTLAGDFDGADDYGYIADSTTLDLVSAMTLEAWIKPTDVSTYRQIIGKFGTPGNYAYQMGLAPSGQIRCDLSGNGSTYDALVSTNAPISANKWHHVVATFGAGNMILYVNGSEVAKRTSIITSLKASTTPLNLGRDPGGIQYFKGVIDEAVIYKRALTAAEVLSHYHSPPSFTVTIASPGKAVSYAPGATGTAIVTATDPVGISSITCTASGAASGNLVIPVDPPQTLVNQNVTFHVAADAAPYAPYTVICSATDIAGLVTTASLSMTVADGVAPTVSAP